MIVILKAVILGVIFATTVQASPNEESTPPPKRTGFIDLNGYYDSRGATGLTINVLANLPASIQYFSLTNVSNATNAMSLKDLDSFYSEQNLRWAPFEALPVALTGQLVIRSGEQNDMFRIGVRWNLSQTSVFSSLGLNYSVTFHGHQFDFIKEKGWRGQLEHAYRLKPFTGHFGSRFYLAGFVDHSLWLKGPAGTNANQVVTEHQLGGRLFDGLHAVVELRYNQYLADKQLGVGFGFQYFMPIHMNP